MIFVKLGGTAPPHPRSLTSATSKIIHMEKINKYIFEQSSFLTGNLRVINHEGIKLTFSESFLDGYLKNCPMSMLSGLVVDTFSSLTKITLELSHHYLRITISIL